MAASVATITSLMSNLSLPDISKSAVVDPTDPNAEIYIRDNYLTGSVFTDFLLTVKQTGLKSYSVNRLRTKCQVDRLGEGVDYQVDLFVRGPNAVDADDVERRQVFVVKYVKLLVPIRQRDGSINIATSPRVKKVFQEMRISQHPPIRSCQNIVEIIGYGWDYIATDTATPCLIVDYAKPGTLRQYLRSRSGEASDDRHLLWKDVAAGLQVLHSCNVIHGDVKLENVLVFEDQTGNPIAKVTDFGSSIILDTRLKSHQYWGSRRYNAPEIEAQAKISQTGAVISRELLKSCDLYSFGLLVWETFLDGEHYFTGQTEATLEICDGSLRKIAFEQLDAFKPKNPFAASEMRTAIAETLILDPTQRSPLTFLKPLQRETKEATDQTLTSDVLLPGTSRSENGYIRFLDFTNRYELFFALVGNRGHGEPPQGPFLPWVVQQKIAAAFKQTCTSDDMIEASLASLGMAVCHYVGFGVDRNVDQVLAYIRESARLGCREARIISSQLHAAFGRPDVNVVPVELEAPNVEEYLSVLQDATKKKPYTTPFPELWKTKVLIFFKTVPGYEETLHTAAFYGNLNLMIKLLENGEKDCRDKYGQTALLLACRSGNLGALQLLIAAGSDASIEDNHKRGPMHMLSMFPECDIEMAGEWLFRSSDKIDLESYAEAVEWSPDYWQLLSGTPLNWAVDIGNVTATRFLVKIGADVKSALHIAASLFRDDLLEILCESPMFDVRKYPELNPFYFLNDAHPFRTLLMHGGDHRAALARTVSVLSRHWPPDSRVYDPTEPLSTALEKVMGSNISLGDVAIAEELLGLSKKEKADFRSRDMISALPACRNSPLPSQAQIAIMLIDAGFSYEEYSENAATKWNAFELAVGLNNIAVVERILQKSPQLINNRSPGHGRTALHGAVLGTGSSDMVRLLLAHGADPTITTDDGVTPLGTYVRQGMMYTCGEMLPILFDVCKRDNYAAIKREGEFRNALHLAAWFSSRFDSRGFSAHQVLRQVLARPEMMERIDLPGSDGYTALLSACHNFGYAAVRILIEAGANPHILTPGGGTCAGLLIDKARLVPPKTVVSEDLETRLSSTYQLITYVSDVMKGGLADEGLSSLHIAAAIGYERMVEQIIRTRPEEVVCRDKFIWTPRQIVEEGLARLAKHPQLDPDWVARAHRIRSLLIQYETL